MNKVVLILFLSWMSLLGYSKEGEVSSGPKTNISGYITEKNSGDSVSYAVVYIKGTTFSTISDVKGYYELKNIPMGKVVLGVKGTGYHSDEKSVNLTGNSNVINFKVSDDDVQLDEVVVSADRNETKKRLASCLVNIVGSKTFTATQSTCLAQGLNFQPGVRTEDDCQNCGFTQVRINGLDGHYSQILIDSRPIFSALNGIYGLEQIPANMIDHVEVVRGGGSALFGASAIGGTINVITKEPERNFGEIGHSIMSVNGSNSFQNVTTMNGSLVTDDRSAGLYVYGESHHKNGFDYNGDGYTEMPTVKGQTMGLKSFFKLSPYSKLTVQYDNISEFRRGGNNLDLPAHEANITEQIDHDINGGSMNYDLYSPHTDNHLNVYYSFQNTDRKSYYGGIGDGSPSSVATALKAYGKTHDLTMLSGAQYKANFKEMLFMPSTLVIGGEYNYDALKDIALGYDMTTKQTVRIYSGFLQNEWKNDKWSFLVGGRFDKHNLIDHVIFSPRVNVRYNLNQNINFRLSYATGFRAPQTFDEDLHVGVVGGNRVKVHLADGLKEEKSNSLSLSADLYHNFGNVQTNLLVEGFYTKLNNVFSERYTNQIDNEGNTILERYNGSGAKVMGVNIEGKAAFSKLFQFQGGVTLQQSKYDKPTAWSKTAKEEKKMFRSPNTYGYFTATYTPVKDLSASLTGTYTGSMLVEHVAGSGTPVDIAVKTPDYFSANFKVAYDIHVYQQSVLQIYAGIQNITNAYQKDFDKGYNRDSNYIYGPSLPRSYYVGTKFSF